jgi:hypothetical protein
MERQRHPSVARSAATAKLGRASARHFSRACERRTLARPNQQANELPGRSIRSRSVTAGPIAQSEARVIYRYRGPTPAAVRGNGSRRRLYAVQPTANVATPERLPDAFPS